MTPLLSLRSVGKAYPGGVVALRDVSLDVTAGEIVAIVGPSGSGKSTLLRLVAGLDEPTAGEIHVDGRPAAGLSPRERDVALVLQSQSLFPHMSVFDNMAYGLRLRGRQAEAKALVENAARMLGIEPLLARWPAALSGGERQRVALGRALARRARFLLLDEPLSSLDAHLRAGLRREIVRVHRELGAVTLLVTHDQGEALSLADRVVVLDHGAVQQVGPPRALLDQPRSRFVAGFIGVPAMAFFAGRVESGPTDAEFRGEGWVVPLGRSGAPLAGRPVVLGVRPGHWLVGGKEDGARTDPGREGRVEWIERTADGTELAHVLVGGTEIVIAFPGRAPEQGALLRLSPDSRHAFLFAEETGERLCLADDPASC